MDLLNTHRKEIGMGFIDVIKERAKKDKQTIILTETSSRRILEAAHQAMAEELADIILVGDKNTILRVGEGLDLSKARIVEPSKTEKLDEYAEVLAKARESKGMTVVEAREILLKGSKLFFGATMVKAGDADGMVAGAVNSSADVLRAALQVVKTAPGTKVVSCFFLMVVPNCDMGENGTFIFADCGLNQNPTSAQLAEIAGSSANSFEVLVEKEPIVAMLSHSTKGSAKHEHVTKVIEATEFAKLKFPQYKIDGELQSDAALVGAIGKSKAPGSEVAGNANVLVFPDLDSGNIGYKLVQRLAKAEAYGPITQGIAAPINDLSRGCSTEDVVGVIAITAVQAQANKISKLEDGEGNENISH